MRPALSFASPAAACLALALAALGGRLPSPLALAALAYLAALLLLVPGLPAGRWLAGRLELPERYVPALGAAAGLVGAMCCFWAYFLSRTAGLVFSYAWIIAAASLVLHPLHGRKLRELTALSSETGRVLALTLLVALFHLSLLYLYLPSLHALDGAHANNRFIAGLPPDNVLSQMLADQLVSGQLRPVLLGDWLTSDRPPLQAAVIALFSPLRKLFGSHALHYQVFATLLQCLWVPAAHIVLRGLGLTVRRSMLAVCAMSMSGFFLLHDTFVWPKLLSGALGTAAFALLFLERGERTAGPRLAAAAGLSALAFLAHGAVAFSLLLFPVCLAKPGMRWRAVPAALAVFLALYAPWMAYQKSFAPPGDRLVKWHLAGSMAIDGRGALRTVVDAYSSRTLGELLAIKASSLKTVFGSFPTGWDQWRSDEFLFTSRALGPLVLGFLPLLLPALVRRTSPAPPDRTAVAAAALFAAASLVLWCLVKWDNTCVHEGSFLTMILLFVLAAAGLVTAPAAVALPLIALDGALFALKWTSLPDSQAAPLPDWTAFSALCLLAAAFLAWRSRRMGDQA